MVKGESKIDPLSDRQDMVGGNTERAVKNLHSRGPGGYFRVKKKTVSTAIIGKPEGGT